MALDSTTLQNAILAAFEKAKNRPPPDDAAQADQLQTQILQTLAQDLAAAINSFVLDADVVDVTVEVSNAGNVIGIGSQTEPGKLE